MTPGDVVIHCRNGRRMTVESVEGKVVHCAYFIGAELFRRAFLADFLLPKETVLA
jgi:uncharacterized protein YodC (DUF2158 family)